MELVIVRHPWCSLKRYAESTAIVDHPLGPFRVSRSEIGDIKFYRLSILSICLINERLVDINLEFAGWLANYDLYVVWEHFL